MTKAPFRVEAPFEPAGDQPRAIAELTAGLERGERYQTLLGVTGSGKTMTLAHVLANAGRPTLVLSHNKTLAAQLYGELKQFLPHNAVEYFVSYYDYYQPEAYVPSTDVYIEKDASINEDIESLRLRATASLMEREDVVIVATVSAIYGLGDPETYRSLMLTMAEGQERGRDAILQDLVGIQYHRNDVAFEPGTFRVRGDTVEIYPAYDEQAVRVELWGDRIERISKIRPAHRRDDPVGASLRHLARQAFRHRAARDRARGPGDSRRARRTTPGTPGGGEAARGPAAGIADHLRHRDDAGGRHLPGHRELLAADRRAAHPAPGRPACWTTSRRTSSWWSTNHMSRCRRSGGCSMAIVPGRPPWSTTGSGSRRRSTTGRSISTSSWSWRRS